jgi:hypothetical protein
MSHGPCHKGTRLPRRAQRRPKGLGGGPLSWSQAAPLPTGRRASPLARSRVGTIFDRSGSAAIERVTAVATPMVPATPIRTSAPPRSAPVHPCYRPTHRSPATTPIAAPPHHRTRWDDWPGNDGDRGRRASRQGRSFSYRRRGRGLKVRGMSGQERRRQERQCSDNREKTLTQDILRWFTLNTAQNPNGFDYKSAAVAPRFIVVGPIG